MENLPLSYNMDTKSLDRTPSLGAESSPDGKPFKRGHIRRSSYESAQIQLNFARRSTGIKGTPAIAQPIKYVTLFIVYFCRKFNEYASIIFLVMHDSLVFACIDEATCSMSFNDKPDCASSTSSEAVDSGLGDSESKRSSLDRRSELSDWEEVVVKPIDETPKGGFFSLP
uniref:Uncharacterized protein n=1 Tax=Heterorhabditis bacteriophora TaxID=37862 RepID=A0A1I7WEL8_HETBA